MRVRVASALVGLGILVVVYIFLDTLLLNVVIGLISILAVFELLKAAGISNRRGLLALSMAQSMVIPFIRAGYVRRLMLPILFLIVLGYFALMVKNGEAMSVERMAMAFMFSTLVPIFFSCAVYIRDDHGISLGGFYLLVALGAAWFSDTGAYFTGVFFGRHKLAPKISPKKTVEGLIGGVVVCTACQLLMGMLYVNMMSGRGIPAQLNYPLLACLAPIFSLVGMLGDLSASAIKREFGIKDFGNIMPGHGGILDRFDSVLFTLPAVYATVRHLELLQLLPHV